MLYPGCSRQLSKKKGLFIAQFTSKHNILFVRAERISTYLFSQYYIFYILYSSSYKICRFLLDSHHLYARSEIPEFYYFFRYAARTTRWLKDWTLRSFPWISCTYIPLVFRVMVRRLLPLVPCDVAVVTHDESSLNVTLPFLHLDPEIRAQTLRVCDVVHTISFTQFFQISDNCRNLKIFTFITRDNDLWLGPLLSIANLDLLSFQYVQSRLWKKVYNYY